MNRHLSAVVGTLMVLALAPAATAQDTAATTTAATGAWTSVVLPEPVSGKATTTHSALATGVAAGPDAVVAVGQRACEAVRGRTWSRCWGVAWTSPDGTTWTAADPATSGLALGRFEPVLSGPEIGLDGVAYGPAGFLAYGRVESRKGGQVPAVWRSDDGVSWKRLTSDDAFVDGARLRSIIGADDGYLLGGVIYKQTPRAAIWSSVDGVTWVPARSAKGADHVFDIGGYINTMEDPLSGGVNDFALYPAAADGHGPLADGVVAVGQACAPALDQEPWAWNGICEGHSWVSADGLAWREGDLARTLGESMTVAVDGSRVVVDAPVCWYDDCSSVVLLADEGMAADVASGSPVGGRVQELLSGGGHFRAVTAVSESFPMGPATLEVWTSEDGTDWTPDEMQPQMPLGAMWLNDVDATVFDDRLLVVASGTEGGAEPGGSVALIGPAAP